MNPLHKMVWVDLETTGLDPNNDSILEIAVIVTSGTNFSEIFATSYVLPLPARTIASFKPEVLEMHGRNGLLAECAKVSSDCRNAEGLLVRSLRSVTDYANCVGPICGSSPHFDKGFLDVHMPTFSKLFSYRTFDVTTLRQAYCNLIAMNGEAPAVDPDNDQHRALADLRWSIAKAKTITEALRKGMYS